MTESFKEIFLNSTAFVLSIFVLVLGIGVIIADLGSAMYTGFGFVNLAGLILGILSIIISQYIITRMVSNDKIF